MPVPTSRRRRAAGCLLATTTALVLSACGSGSSTSDASASPPPTSGAPVGSLSRYDLSGLELSVGSDNYTEQLVLGNLAVQALEAAGAEVDEQIGLAGTTVVREALLNDDIDAYWEYTGTAWISFLDETQPLADPVEQYDAVAAKDLSENGIRWFAATPFNNTYQIAVREEAAAELGVTKLSDLGTLLRDRPDEATICVGPEFSQRDDGLPGMQKAYGYAFPEESVQVLDDGVIYDQVDKGDSCNFGVVFATDGRIEALGLTTLEDDQAFFPSYNAAVVVHDELATSRPALAELFGALAAKLDTATMRGLNAQVDVDGEEPETVAEDWLKANGFTT